MDAVWIAIGYLLGLFGLLETLEFKRIRPGLLYLVPAILAVAAPTLLSQSHATAIEYPIKLLLFGLTCLYFSRRPRRALVTVGIVSLLGGIDLSIHGAAPKYVTSVLPEFFAIFVLWRILDGRPPSRAFCVVSIIILEIIGFSMISRASSLAGLLILIYLVLKGWKAPVKYSYLVPLVYTAALVVVAVEFLNHTDLVRPSTSSVERSIFLYLLFFASGKCYLAGCNVDAITTKVTGLMRLVGINHLAVPDPHSFYASLFMYSGLLPVVIFTIFLIYFSSRIHFFRYDTAVNLYARTLLILFFAETLTIPPSAYPRIMIAFAVGQMLWLLHRIKDQVADSPDGRYPRAELSEVR